MLANPEQYDDADGCVTFRIKVSSNGFGASVLWKDGTWADFAASSSVSTFCRVMENICSAKSAADPPVRFVTANAVADSAAETAKLKALFAEMWGAVCPDCGPEDYPAIAALIISEEAKVRADLIKTIAQVKRETAEACAELVCDADVLRNRDYERSDDGRGSLAAAAKEIREKYGIAASK